MANVYYSQIDTRWKNHPYPSQQLPKATIGSGGCGPTTAAMIVSSIKKVITPDKMGDWSMSKGYRVNGGTANGLFEAVAKEYKIEFARPKTTNEMADYIKKGWYVVVLVGTGQFSYGGHFVSVMELNDKGELGVYDSYLYAGKFDKSGRAGKGRLVGTTYWIKVKTFKDTANAIAFFAFKAEGTGYDPIPVPSGKTKQGYVKTKELPLNVRSGPGINYSVIGSLAKGTKVTIYDEKNKFYKIGDEKWASSEYVSTSEIKDGITKTMTVTAKSGLNVRSAPNTSSRIVSAYSYGTKVQVQSISNGWAKVSKGYMSTQYLK